MKLMTPVELNCTPVISHRDRLMMLGSCFSENIGEKLRAGGFYIDVNPFGVLYNPLSIAHGLTEIIQNKIYSEADLLQYDGLWHSFMHHGSFSTKSKTETLELINHRIEKAHEEWNTTTFLFLTFGSAYVYIDKSNKQVVSNCHKIPDKYFERRRLTVEEISDTYISLFDTIFKTNNHLKIIFTVSPIRHMRDGLHENELSKSILLLSIDKIKRYFPNNILYFPAYEIMMDELRDYRFYDNDLLHPSDMAIEYIWKSFSKSMFSIETINLIKECNSIYSALSHNPLHPENDTYKEFLGQIVLKINRLKEKIPYLEFKNY